MCKKVRYHTRRDARSALKSLMGRGNPCRGCHPYRCPTCDFFHIGHMAPDIRRGIITRGEAYS